MSTGSFVYNEFSSKVSLVITRSCTITQMSRQVLWCVLLFGFCAHSFAKVGYGSGEQEWGYVNVRRGAQMFWWLYYTTADVESYYQKPLIIWLQGGPGGSSTGFGNFELIGPLNVRLKPRKYNWVDYFNVLFIDSPVGTGFSFVKGNAFATTNKQVADDLLACVKDIFKKDPKLSKVRTYIVGESYGGKTAIEFARIWHEAEQSGEIESKLKGVALGDAWISPIDSVMSWGLYLLQTGMVDDVGYRLIERFANYTKDAVDEGNWNEATRQWGKTEVIIDQVTSGIDFYNIMTKKTYYDEEKRVAEFKKSSENDPLESVMNSEVKLKLNLTTTWGEQAQLVFWTHRAEFMKPVIDQVEYVLNNTDLNVCVYTGQLDLIVDTPGTMTWVNNMQWTHAQKWHYSPRDPFVVKNIIQGYVKKYKNFAVYWINRSGHMVPKDNPITALEMIKDFTA